MAKNIANGKPVRIIGKPPFYWLMLQSFPLLRKGAANQVDKMNMDETQVPRFSRPDNPKRPEGVKNWLPGGPADETVCPTFLAVQGFANWVVQAVSPAGPIF